MVWEREISISLTDMRKEQSTMAKAQRYLMEQIENARKKLRSLAAKKVGKTRAEVAGLLAGEIRKAVEQGSLQEIRNVLAQPGVQVSLAQMRNLLGGPDEKDSDVGEGKDKNGINLEESQANAFPKTGIDSDEVRQEEVRL
jgi:hypothetical protein